jgi:peptidoglycan/LPS O-acetylase OafA/YrhL
MRATQGEYFVGLDHVRALAAFLVFTWHFNHVSNGHLKGPEAFPFAILAEGHVGVAMFMTLSGYLFAKLLDGQQIRYFSFLWNRVLRIFPLLIVVFLVFGFLHYDASSVGDYLIRLVKGFFLPVWPYGGWSIAVEIHFYLILPLLLAISSKRAANILFVLVLSIGFRMFWWWETGTIQFLSYWTIVGGIDQFLLGVFAFKTREWMTRRHLKATVLGIGLLAYMWIFDSRGGFYRMGVYPSENPIWIIHPTILGIVFAALIAWYDASFRMKDEGISGTIAKIGACSYSIYLLHFFFVFSVAKRINSDVITLSSFPMVLAASLMCFLCFAPVAFISYRLIELPPLRYRMHYKRPISEAQSDGKLQAVPTKSM